MPTPTLKEYTLRRRMIMDALLSVGLPVLGSIEAKCAKACKRSKLVVAKIGAEPLHSRWPDCPGTFCGRTMGTPLPSYHKHCAAKDSTVASNRQSSSKQTLACSRSSKGKFPFSGLGNTSPLPEKICNNGLRKKDLPSPPAAPAKTTTGVVSPLPLVKA